MLNFRKFMFRRFLIAGNLALLVGLAACSGDEVAGITGSNSGSGGCDITVSKMNSFYRGMSSAAVSNSLGCQSSKTDTFSSSGVALLFGSITSVYAYCLFITAPELGTGLLNCQYSENGTNTTDKRYY